VPLLVYLKLFTNLVERSGAGDWAKLFLVAAACFATLLTPFVITLNNHSVGTYCVLFALYAAVRIWEITAEGKPAPAYLFVLAGLFAAFAACNELPALAFTAALGLVLLLRARGRTLACFVPAAAVPLAAFVLTNYLAVGQLRPAYAEFGGPWYEYEGSHWSNRGPHRTGIDMAGFHESWGAYVFHVLIGHHGWFSLTPIWLFAVAGMFGGLAAARGPGAAEGKAEGLPRFIAPLTLAVSAVVIAFYLSRGDRNYGGWTNGLRWLIWLTPLWLLCMTRVLDRVAANRWGRWAAYVLLGVSVLSASYYSWNPWRHPWLYRLMDAQGWIPY
jgi:hypothetical protein